MVDCGGHTLRNCFTFRRRIFGVCGGGHRLQSSCVRRATRASNTHTHTGELCEQGARNSGLWHLFPATWRFWGRPGNPTHCRRIDPALSNEDCWGPTQMQKVCTKFSHCFSPTEFLFEYVNEFTTFVITPTELQDV